MWGRYAVVRTEGMIPSPDQISAAEERIGRGGITTTLYDYWSPVHGNIITTAPHAPDDTYCQQAYDCFGMGLVFDVSGIPNTVPLDVYVNTTTGHHVMVACAATTQWAIAHGYVRVSTVGWVYPPLAASTAQLEAGVTSELDSIPAGFRHRVMIIAGKGTESTSITNSQMFSELEARLHTVSSPSTDLTVPSMNSTVRLFDLFCV